MIILGLNAYHGDSSACLVADGQLVCAIEEERLRRAKHWAGLPTEAVRWCLDYAGLTFKDVDHIAVSRDPSAHLHKKILRVLTRAPKLDFLTKRLQNAASVKDIKTSLAHGLQTDPAALKARVYNVEHHRAHMAAGFFTSPFDSASVVSVDGFGDFVSTMRGTGRGNTIEINDWVEYPHSIGIFYTAMTQFLGFPKYGDEYKVMGLSALGEPSLLSQMREILKPRPDGFFRLDVSYFLHHRDGVDMVWEEGEPAIGRLFSDKTAGLLGPARDGMGRSPADMETSRLPFRPCTRRPFFISSTPPPAKAALTTSLSAAGASRTLWPTAKSSTTHPLRTCTSLQPPMTRARPSGPPSGSGTWCSAIHAHLSWNRPTGGPRTPTVR